MGRISEQDIQRVREATDIAEVVADRVVLQRKGALLWGRCPFHEERTPSFKVDPATQLWHCFGCGLGGDVFGFLMRAENLEFPEAVRMLAERARIEIVESEGGIPRSHKERLVAACEQAAEFYRSVLLAGKDAKAQAAREYLSGRGFGSQVAKSWGLGFSPGGGALVRALTSAGFSADELIGANLAFKSDSGQLRDRFYERVMFPILDLQGRCIAFGGRVLGSGEPKYLNTAETPIFSKGRNLYAIDRAKAGIVATGTAVVVEGYTDVIALHEAGVTNVVATLGTALTREHVRLLGRFAGRVVYLFDGDEAGLRAADRAAGFIDRTVTPEAGRERVELMVATIPGARDPAELVAEEGADAVREVIGSAQPLLRFAIDRRLAQHDLGSAEGRARALADAASVLVPVKESVLAGDYAGYIADRISSAGGRGLSGVDAEQVLAEVNRSRSATEPTRGAPEGSAAAASARRDTPRARAEWEIVGLLGKYPELRGQAQDLLEEELLTVQDAADVAAMLAEAGTAGVADVVARLEQDRPELARLLAASVPEDVSDAAGLAEHLRSRLRAFDLKERIQTGQARLRDPEGFKDPTAYDELFKEVSQMTRELAELEARLRED